MTTKTTTNAGSKELLLAFHGDPRIKKKYIARVRAHREAEHLVQGTGWDSNGTTKGCAVGCTLDAYDHSRYPVELGVPVELAHLEDLVFERLPWSDPAAEMDAQRWPEAFLSAIRPGADLSGVASEFRRGVALDAILTHWPEEGGHEAEEGDRAMIVTWLATDDDELRGSVRTAAYAAADAAADAAAYAADAAADAAYAADAATATAAAAYAAADAAYAAAYAAADAADAAYAAADAAYAARRAHWQYMASQLLRLLAKAPTTKAQA